MWMLSGSIVILCSSSKCVRRIRVGMSFKVSFDNITSDIEMEEFLRRRYWFQRVWAQMDQDRSNVSPERTHSTVRPPNARSKCTLLRWAMEEISGRPLWQYLDGYEHPEARSLKVAPPLVAAFQCKTIGRTMPL
jgi:hypothetical protein